MDVQTREDAAATIDAHLAAVVNRDLDAYLATVHPNVTVIITSGAMLRGKDAVADFHREWFADPNWTYQATPVRTVSTDAAVSAVVEVTYRGGPDAEPSRFLMGLVFARESNKWLLVHDQCTVLRTE
jgi:uncharacterized protein (TIGR02246 family)